MGKLSKKKEKRKVTRFSEFVISYDVLTEESRKECLAKLNEAECPKFLGGVAVPENLNMITFGQYQELADAIETGNDIQAMYEFAQILLNIPLSAIENAPAYDVWGFGNFVGREIHRINNLFNNINMQHTSEEELAGIGRLQFGFFGILDWYARRMGITDHNEVNKIPWVRIYQCMKNDAEETQYQRRLQQIYRQTKKEVI